MGVTDTDSSSLMTCQDWLFPPVSSQSFSVWIFLIDQQQTCIANMLKSVTQKVCVVHSNAFGLTKIEVAFRYQSNPSFKAILPHSVRILT